MYLLYFVVEIKGEIKEYYLRKIELQKINVIKHIFKQLVTKLVLRSVMT